MIYINDSQNLLSDCTLNSHSSFCSILFLNALICDYNSILYNYRFLIGFNTIEMKYADAKIVPSMPKWDIERVKVEEAVETKFMDCFWVGFHQLAGCVTCPMVPCVNKLTLFHSWVISGWVTRSVRVVFDHYPFPLISPVICCPNSVKANLSSGCQLHEMYLALHLLEIGCFFSLSLQSVKIFVNICLNEVSANIPNHQRVKAHDLLLLLCVFLFLCI